MGIPALQPWYSFDGTMGSQVFSEAHQKLFSQVCMSDFAASKLDICLDAITFLQKPNGVGFFEIVIVVVGIRAKFNFFHLDHVLLFLSRLLLFFLFVLIVPKIDRPGHRRNLGRSD